jgi:hypothetical protein
MVNGRKTGETAGFDVAHGRFAEEAPAADTRCNVRRRLCRHRLLIVVPSMISSTNGVRIAVAVIGISTKSAAITP